MYCKKCGKEINDNARFCKYCGTEFVKKEKVNGKMIVKEMKDVNKPKNKNAYISIIFAIAAIVCCLLPLSQFGMFAVVGGILAGMLALFFRLRGKHEMYQIYENEGGLTGKGMLDVSLCMSVLCIALAIITITRFI